MGVLRVDNSRLTSVATCDTQAVLQYVHGYQAKDEPAPRMGGKVGHESLAHYFNTGDKEAALKVFWDNYKPFSDQHQVEDGDMPQWGFRNMYDVLKHYYATHPIERFPFKIVEGSVETAVVAKLTDDIEMWCMLDWLSRENVTAGLYPGDNKFRGAGITHWWLRQFIRGSQLTGYMWAAQQQYGEVVPGAYLNAIDMKKLPDLRYKKDGTPYKCKKHGTLVTECRMLHSEHQLKIVTRTPQAIEDWKVEATGFAQKFQRLVRTFPDIGTIEYAGVQGTFNGGCTFCQFKDFCNAGRRPELIEGMLIHAPWEPWNQ